MNRFFQRLWLIYRANTLDRQLELQKLRGDRDRKQAALEIRHKENEDVHDIKTNSDHIICPHWDKTVNELCDMLESGRVTPSYTEYNEVHIGPFKIWNANWPYAYGHPVSMSIDCKSIPTPATRLRLRRVLADSGVVKDKMQEMLDQVRKGISNE